MKWFYSLCTFLIAVGILILIIPLSSIEQTPFLQESESPWSRFNIELGGFLADINSSMRVGKYDLGIGLNINLEETLGLSIRSLTFRGQLLYRFSKTKRHAVRALYFQIVRKSTKAIQIQLKIRDKTFSAGTELSSKFNMWVI